MLYRLYPRQKLMSIITSRYHKESLQCSQIVKAAGRCFFANSVPQWNDSVEAGLGSASFTAL